MGAFAGSASSNGQTNGLQTKLTAKEVALKKLIFQKSGLLRHKNPSIMNYKNNLLSQEFGSLAVAERESRFDPKAVNTGGGGAKLVHFQWSLVFPPSMGIAGQKQSKRN